MAPKCDFSGGQKNELIIIWKKKSATSNKIIFLKKIELRTKNYHPPKAVFTFCFLKTNQLNAFFFFVLFHLLREVSVNEKKKNYS